MTITVTVEDLGTILDSLALATDYYPAEALRLEALISDLRSQAINTFN